MCVMTFYGCLLLLMVLQMFNTLEQTIEIEGLFTREREREREMHESCLKSKYNWHIIIQRIIQKTIRRLYSTCVGLRI